MATTPPQPAADLGLPFPLQGGESILAIFRRHWWFLWPRSVLLVAVAVLPVAVLAWLFDAVGLLDDLGIWFWLIALGWLAVGGVRLFLNWYRYHHDIWVVTNQRIVDAYKAHPLSLRIASADLVNIQDMSVVRSGLTPTILNYGTVVCETAGAGISTFLISGVPRPDQVQLLIDRERDRERGRRP